MSTLVRGPDWWCVSAPEAVGASVLDALVSSAAVGLAPSVSMKVSSPGFHAPHHVALLFQGEVNRRTRVQT